MKKFTQLISFLILCLLCFTAWAAPSFQYQIEGITAELLQNAQDQLKVDAPAKNTELTVADIHQRYLAAPAQIIKALQPFGYYNARVQSRLSQQGDAWHAIYQVTPGPPLRITQLQLSIVGPGQDDVELRKLANQLPLRTGQRLKMQAYENAKQALFNTAQAQGFMSAQLTQHEIRIDLKNYTATVILQLSTGPRFYFGDIHFSPNPFKESFLRRFMPFKEGDPYSTKKLLTLQDNLINSNYFSKVNVQAQREQAQHNAVPTQIMLRPRRPQQYTVGLGYGTDTGVRGTLGWDWRRVTATGHRFSTLLQLSQVQNSLQAIYSIPGSNPSTDQYNITASALNNRIQQGESFTQQFGVADITAYGNWKRTLALNYQFERFQFDDESTQHSNLLIPGVSWTYLKADDTIFPAQGQQLTLSLKGANDTLLSSSSFAQVEIKDKYITTPTRHSRLILRADIGYTAIKDTETLPLSQFFYAGGTQSMRGYKYQSLGPGRYLTVGSAELQHRIFGDWYAAVFYDIGNASDHINTQLMRAAGAGIVWRSPLGPMELTVAKALNKPGRPNQIQFSMGPDFG